MYSCEHSQPVSNKAILLIFFRFGNLALFMREENVGCSFYERLFMILVPGIGAAGDGQIQNLIGLAVERIIATAYSPV